MTLGEFKKIVAEMSDEFNDLEVQTHHEWHIEGELAGMETHDIDGISIVKEIGYDDHYHNHYPPSETKVALIH